MFREQNLARPNARPACLRWADGLHTTEKKKFNNVGKARCR